MKSKMILCGWVFFVSFGVVAAYMTAQTCSVQAAWPSPYSCGFDFLVFWILAAWIPPFVYWTVTGGGNLDPQAEASMSKVDPMGMFTPPIKRLLVGTVYKRANVEIMNGACVTSFSLKRDNQGIFVLVNFKTRNSSWYYVLDEDDLANFTGALVEMRTASQAIPPMA